MIYLLCKSNTDYSYCRKLNIYSVKVIPITVIAEN